MHRQGLFLLALGLIVLVPASVPAQKAKVFPERDSDIPGPFTTFNATGPLENSYRCLVSEHALNPVVMLIIRKHEVENANEWKGLLILLKKLDAAVKANPITRLTSFAVFPLSGSTKDDFDTEPRDKDIIRDDKDRKDMQGKLKTIWNAPELMLQQVVFAVANQKSLAKYKWDDKTEVMVLFYDRYRVVFHYRFEKVSDLTPEKAGEIMGELAKHFPTFRSE